MRAQRSFLSSLKWAYSANWGERGFSALFMFVVAGLLGPRDIGVIAIAMTYIMFLQMFLDQGLAAALIQREILEEEHLDAVFWMDLALSAVLVAVSVVLSGWWAARNHAPEAGPIIAVISLSIPIEALSVVQTSLLRRHMDFRSLSIRANISVVASGVLGIGMALTGFGVWSLVGQQLARDVIALILLWRLSEWRPRLVFSWRHLTDLLDFSIPNFTAQLANFTENQSGAIVLGLLFGPLALGLYRLAARLVNSVVVMATSSIQGVALPAFSQAQRDPEDLRAKALSCIRLSAMITLPALAGLAAVSHPLMATLGSQWIPAANLLKILCAAGMCIIFAYFTGPMMQALAQTRKLAILEWVRTIAGVVLLALAGLLARGKPISTQIMAIGLATLATSAILVAPAFLYILMRLASLSALEILKSTLPSLATAAAVVSAVATCELSGLLSGNRPLFRLTVEVLFGAAVGGGGIILTRLRPQNYSRKASPAPELGRPSSPLA